MSVQPQNSDCFLHIPQEFLVCTTIHKARNLSVLNANTYVKVSLGKATKATKVFSSSENPYYNEYFVFELLCTLAELLRLTVVFDVKKRTCCKTHVTLGKLHVDLYTVWNQPHRSFYKKWGKLLGSSPDVRGHLQIDLVIVSPNHPAFPAPIDAADADNIESNLLQDLDLPVCNIRYQISLHRGMFVKKGDYLVEVSLAGMKGKTKVSKSTHNPEWGEIIRFNWTYPSLSQTLILQVMCLENLSWKCAAECEIYLDEISFNVAPNLGPTFIHFYDGHNYVGRVLVEISAEKLTSVEQTIGGMISVAHHVNFSTHEWWNEETFVFEFVTWQGDFVHTNVSNMKISMNLGEHKSENLECFLKSYSSHKITLKNFTQTAPFKAVHLTCSLPDNRLKYEADQFMLELVDQIKSEMETFKHLQLKYPQEESMHCKCLKAIILTILDTIQDPQNARRLHYNGFKQQTTWDAHRLVFIREFFSGFTAHLKDLRESLKTPRDRGSACDRVCQELQQLRQQIESIVLTRAQDEWPELQLHMCVGVGKASKKFAICKLNAQHFVFSQRSECSGHWCGVPRNFVFKDWDCVHTCRNCGCVMGVVYGWLRVAAEAEQTEFSFTVDWVQKERFYYQPKVENSHVMCRVYVHQAKIQPGADSTGLCDARLRLVFGEKVIETSTVAKSLAPVWDETVAFAVRQMAGPISWYESHPPLLGVEMFDVDRLKTNDFIGCGLLELSVSSREPVKSAGSAFHGKEVESERSAGQSNSNSAILNLRKFLKTRVALEKLRELKNLSPPMLKWIPIAHMGASRVEVLMSGELLQVAEHESPDDAQAELVEGIPREIQPSMGKFLLEVIFIGLRHSQMMSSSSLGRYSVHVIMGELILKSGISGTRLKNSINFLDNFASGTVSLPLQFQYWPPIIVTLIDRPGHSHEVTLAAALISDPKNYLGREERRCDFDENDESSVIQVGEDDESVPLLPTLSKKPLWLRLKSYLWTREQSSGEKPAPSPAIDEADYTWWTKFYNSLHTDQAIESSHKHRLAIYTSELEKEADFSFLTDWAQPFPLIHGVRIKKNHPSREKVYATLKMHFKLSQCACNSATSATINSTLSRISSQIQTLHAMSDPVNVMVRVYLVQGMNFRSRDAYSQSDSYVKLHLGPQMISDRANYICNQSNPIYGKRFQLPATIPREHVLQISVYDRGGAGDQLIGATFIDLEDRVRSKHRATVGIANEFNRTGYNAWRDAMTPREILTEVCRKHGLQQPNFGADTIEVDGVTFDASSATLDEDAEERLSLVVLKNLHVLPTVGYRIVPEHVETRSLYRPDRPGVEQGKLQLWVEIFDASNVPPPIDITPTPPSTYELRVVVYNCAGVPFQERNVFGAKMSDIYIKGWCEDNGASQQTDVHYRSLNGDGSFNWRMIFPLKYSPVEDMMVIKQKGGFFEVYETKQPPMVYLQIWDDDVLSADDFIGALDLCLSQFPEPFATQAACTATAMKKRHRKFVNLFREKSVRGWFPCRGPSEKDHYTTAGKLELGLEILSEQEAAASPAGLGRSPPNPLPAPERPETSFNPWSNPVKSIKHIIAPVVMKCLRCGLLVVLAAVVLYVLFQDVVQHLLEKI